MSGREGGGREGRTGLNVHGFGGTVDHGHAAWVQLEHVVGKGNDGDDSSGGCREGQSGETLDERCDEGGGKMARGEDQVGLCWGD